MQYLPSRFLDPKHLLPLHRRVPSQKNNSCKRSKVDITNCPAQHQCDGNFLGWRKKAMLTSMSSKKYLKIGVAWVTFSHL